MKQFFFTILCLAATSASAADFPAPARLERADYFRWLQDIKSVRSPFEEYIFNWYDQQRNAPLPKEVSADAQKLLVVVDDAIAKTNEFEESGDIESGVTYGIETYGIIDADPAMVLETILFRWGKPVGAAEGVTHPNDALYSRREEKLQPGPGWGPGAYRTQTKRSGGGFVNDMNDVFSLVVRDDGAGGYIIAGTFLGPNGPKRSTQTTSSMTIMTLRRLPDGTTDYRILCMFMGQSYSFFGIDFGRRNYGFNHDRIREGQLDFYGQVAELKKTGKITERRQ